MIRNKLEGLLSELKKFKVYKVLALESKKKNDQKIFHSSEKRIASDSDIDETFKSMLQSTMKKTKNYASKDCIVLDLIIKHSVKILQC